MTSNPSPAHPRFSARLKTLRTNNRRTQADIGRHLHVTADAVRKWESGRSAPDPDTVHALDTYLAADGLLYGDYLADTRDRTNNRTGTGQVLSAATVLADSAQQTAEFGAWAETSNVGEVAITALHNHVRLLLERTLTEPPEIVARDTADVNTHLFTLLRGHHKPAHARALYRAAGGACALLTWLAGDLGALDVAHVHAATAAMCAEMSEDPETAAWVAAVRSKTEFWAGNYGEAARIAHVAALQHAPGTAAVMLACQEADAHAKLGDAAATESALDAAARAADRIREADRFGGLFACGPARAANYACAAHVQVGANTRALVEADQALAAFAYDGGYGFGTIAQVHVTRALAYGATGQIDAAADAARPVLDLPPDKHLATLGGRLAPLERMLATPALAASRTARTLREEIREFRTPAPRRALPGPHQEETP